MREQRRLAAIVSADVAGYSRLMGRDESGTLAALKELRREVIDPRIDAHGGRIVKTTGDGLLLEFPSVVDAVRCMVEVQTVMAARDADTPDDRRIAFRIGVNLGDIIIDGDDIFGDGVNIAARLQEIASPGGVCVSSRVHDDVRDRLDIAFEEGGAQALKNIARPVQVWRWSPGAVATAKWAASETPAPTPAPLALPDKPSIAVLPFSNMSGDPEQEYFTDGVTEDIITELSRFHSLFVIARNSTFTYKGKATDVRQVAKDLGVRYVVEGSIRKAANRVRVTAQLIDALTGNHLWAERYDRVLEDIFEVQEEVTRNIVAAIAPQIDAAELATIARRRPENLSAYEIAMRAWANTRNAVGGQDRTFRDRAIREAQVALAIDPRSVLAQNVIAYANWQHYYLGTAADAEGAWQDGMNAAAQAIALDASDHRGYVSRGRLLAIRGGRWDEALNAARRACELNPNDSFALLSLASIETWDGNSEESIPHLLQVIRANPRNPWGYHVHAMLAVACFVGKDYAKGVKWALLAEGEAPNLTAALQHLTNCCVGVGDIERAKAALEKLRRLAPEFVESRLGGESLFRRPEDRARQVVFMRIAAGLEDPSAAEAVR